MAWTLVGNIKGQDSSQQLPDPLVVDNEVRIGDKLRMIKLSNGGRVEAQDADGDWITQAEWTES